jgi:hypothetical protein
VIDSSTTIGIMVGSFGTKVWTRFRGGSKNAECKGKVQLFRHLWWHDRVPQAAALHFDSAANLSYAVQKLLLRWL